MRFLIILIALIAGCCATNVGDGQPERVRPGETIQEGELGHQQGVGMVVMRALGIELAHAQETRHEIQGDPVVFYSPESGEGPTVLWLGTYTDVFPDHPVSSTALTYWGLCFYDDTGDNTLDGLYWSNGSTWFQITDSSAVAGFIDGSGTATYLPVWTDSDTLSDSVISEISAANGSIAVTGASPQVSLYKSGNAVAILFGNVLILGDGTNAADTYLMRQAAGTFSIDGSSAGPGVLRFYEDSDTGSNYFEIGSASSRTTSQSVTWPDDTPVNGDFLQWTTGGQLVWTAGGPGGSSDNITSPDTNTHAYVYDAINSGFQVTVESTLMQKQLQTQLDLYDDNIRLFDQLSADATGDLYFMGGSTSTTGSYRISTSTAQFSMNHDSADKDTKIAADNGEAFRVDGGLYGVGIGGEVLPYCALSVDGGLQYGYTEKTTSFTYDPTAAGNDDNNIILLDCTTGSITVTLPNPDSTRSYNVTFIRVDSTVANDCIIDANSTWDIDGSDDIYIYEQWESYTLQAGSYTNMGGNTEWVITAHVEPHDRFMWDCTRVSSTVVNTYTVQPEDQFIRCSTGITAFTVTLPSAASYPGRRLVIKDYGGGAAARNITVSRAGSDTIDGATTQTISTNYGCLTLVSDGASVWMIEY